MMDIPASPPTFSFPRITRRRRHTNTGASPSQAPTTGQPSAVPSSAQSPSQPPHSPVNSNPITPGIQQISNNPLAIPNDQTDMTHVDGGERQTYRIRLVPHLESARSLHFEPIIRDVKVGGPPLRVGRFTDRATNPPRGNGLNPNDRNSDKVAFRSKVVSRAHAELWVQGKGMFFLKDTKSSSGTFINHMRLSPPGQESVAHILKDGDVIQLGVDYQGGTEEMYRCVKIKVEVGQGREWQGGANAFNTAALKQLRTLQAGEGSDKAVARKTVGDCCICLFSVSVCQSLFIAPCSHAFHYKCIRPMLELHHPGFSCPLCRTFADLEADVEVDEQELKAIADALDEAEEAAGTNEAEHHVNGVQQPHLAAGGSSLDDAILVDSDEGSPIVQRTVPAGGPNRTGAAPAIPRRDPPPPPTTGQLDVNGRQRDSAVEDDRLVEDALEVDYDGEDDEGDERMVSASADEFGGRHDEEPMDITVSPTKRFVDYGQASGSAPATSGPVPLKIDSSRRGEPDSQADREARELANATTPLNNTFMTMAHSLMGTVGQGAGYNLPDLPSHSELGAFEDDGTGTEAENGASRPRRTGPASATRGAAIALNGASGSAGSATGAARGGLPRTQALSSREPSV